MDIGGVSRVRFVAVGVSDRWKVTCDMGQVRTLILLNVSINLRNLKESAIIMGCV